jgi:two-component system phosphate regulon sensor histidine kinase PhoR
LVLTSGTLALIFSPLWALGLSVLGAVVLISTTFALIRSSPATQQTVAEKPAEPLSKTARIVLECLGEPVLVLDQTEKILFANRAAHSLLGEGLTHKRLAGVLRTPELLEAIARVRAGSPAETVSFSFLVPVERHYQAYIARTESADGSEPLLLMQWHDITTLRRAEQMRVDFVANASHELRTPLAAVSGFIETLRGHAKDDPAARERFLDIMSVQAGRMRRLIDDLLSLSRIELNEHNPPSGAVELTGLVHDAAAALAPLAAADKVKIEIAPHDPLHVTGDRDELIQVFQNLLHNAIKYGRTGGTIHVRFGRVPGAGRREAEGWVFAAVADEGEGIAREVIPRLTERFYRVDVKRSRERGGTGLGLAIVKHILNRHHGRLQIDSTPGQGSTFTVFLPQGAQENPQ